MENRGVQKKIYINRCCIRIDRTNVFTCTGRPFQCLQKDIKIKTMYPKPFMLRAIKDNIARCENSR